MATNLFRGSLSVINNSINYVPMGSWTLNRVQDVYNKVKDTSPNVVSKSLDRVESVVQQFIANPEETTFEETDTASNGNLQSLKLPENLTDEQVQLLNQFLASFVKEKTAEEENQTAKRKELKTPEIGTTKSVNLKPATEEFEKPLNLTRQQLEWSRQMMRWVTVGFFAVHTGFQDIIYELEKENDHCSKYNPKKPYYQKLTSVMARCAMDWVSRNDFMDIMMKIFKTVTLTGDLLKNYILLGRRMVVCSLKKLETEKPLQE